VLAFVAAVDAVEAEDAALLADVDADDAELEALLADVAAALSLEAA
jgi:hypothetical protein